MSDIYGHDMDLTQQLDGEVITDVIVIARTVHYDDTGRAHDNVLMTVTKGATEMIQQAMLNYAVELADFPAVDADGE